MMKKEDPPSCWSETLIIVPHHLIWKLSSDWLRLITCLWLVKAWWSYLIGCFLLDTTSYEVITITQYPGSTAVSCWLAPSRVTCNTCHENSVMKRDRTSVTGMEWILHMKLLVIYSLRDHHVGVTSLLTQHPCNHMFYPTKYISTWIPAYIHNICHFQVYSFIYWWFHLSCRSFLGIELCI